MGHLQVDNQTAVPGDVGRSLNVVVEPMRLMNVDTELLAEIKDQLQDDILHFGWLCQIVRLKDPHDTDAGRIETVVDAVIELHQDGMIIVGRVSEIDGTVLIDPWPGQDHELRARIQLALDNSNEQDRDFCFWIQLAEHAAREQ